MMCVCVGMSSSVTSMYGVTELAMGFDAIDDQSSYDRLMLKSRRLRGVLGDEDKLITELSGRGYRWAGVGSLGDARGEEVMAANEAAKVVTEMIEMTDRQEEVWDGLVWRLV